MISSVKKVKDLKNFQPGLVIETDFLEYFKYCYSVYGISTVKSRALPDIITGLKPVQIRIIASMWNNSRDKFVKSAKVVAQTMFDYHPHGNTSIYYAAVRMAQPQCVSVPLLKSQGNIGDVDNSPAAERYTELALDLAAHYICSDLKYSVVEMAWNYDATLLEPKILPVQFPLLLVNGSYGIAVGYKINSPPHNLNEVIQATKMILDNKDCSVDELMKVLRAPDFPTGGEILFSSGIKEFYETGKGTVTARAKAEISDKKIIFTEVPYSISKILVVTQIASLIWDGIIEGAHYVADESDKYGIRIVVYLKKTKEDADPSIIINNIFKYTYLQKRYNINMNVICDDIPQQVNLKKVIVKFLEFRNTTIISKFSYKLKEGREKIHTLIGLVVVKDNVEKILRLTRNSNSTSEALELLHSESWNSPSMENLLDEEFDSNINFNDYKLSKTQAQAILDMRVNQLTKLENEELLKKIKEIRENIKYYSLVISSQEERNRIIHEELDEINRKLSTSRKSTIITDYEEIKDEELMENESFIVLIDLENNIKKIPITEYKLQHRGGLGKSGTYSSISCSIIANTLSTLLLFSNIGRVYVMRCYKIPTMSSSAKGRALINFLPHLQNNEIITNILNMDIISNNYTHIVCVTEKGIVRKSNADSFINIRVNGKNAINLNENDFLKKVICVTDEEDLIIISKKGRAVRFDVKKMRETQSCNTIGVIGMRLSAGDRVVDACSSNDDSYLVSVSKKGLCKITSVDEYRDTNKGAKGVICMKISENDEIVSAFTIDRLEGEIFSVTNSGQIVRSSIDEIRETGRNTKGVRLLRFKEEGDFVFKSMKYNEEDILKPSTSRNNTKEKTEDLDVEENFMQETLDYDIDY